MITWNGLTFIGTPDDADQRAANALVDDINEQRANEDPPLSPLPKATGAELKTSLETILLDKINKSWESQVAKQRKVDFDAEDRSAVKEAYLKAIARGADSSAIEAAIDSVNP
jgi:hypothetical protein